MVEFKSLGNVRFPYDVMLVRDIEDESSSWSITGKDGEKIVLSKDSIYSVMRSDYIPDEVMNICFKGEVVKMPNCVSSSITPISVDVEEGDVCYFHHSLCDPDNRVKVGGEYFYMIPYKVNYLTISLTNVYLKLCSDGSYAMVDKWVLVEPIEEEVLKSDTLFLLNSKKKSDKYYKVLSVKPNDDVYVGDEVITTRGYVKTINLGGKVSYVVHSSHILGKRIVQH